jgi:hypothetical protein
MLHVRSTGSSGNGQSRGGDRKARVRKPSSVLLYRVTRLYVLYSGRTVVLGVISPPVYVIGFRTHSTEQWS